MKEIVLNTNTQKSVIYCGSGAFEKYAHIDGGVFVVTDDNVYSLYRGLIEKTFNGAAVKVIRAGEKSKNIKTLTAILQSMVNAGLKRSGTVVALGGGVVGDIAGLAASLYMRGVHLVQIPTTLLSQVDSSVGGKTAVDFNKVKNLVGSFYQPEKVIVDPLFLKTLPDREINCGLGEIIKYGALDKGIYQKLQSADDLNNPEFLEDITADCIQHKAHVVTVDEHDLNGARKTLNLGHTTGHAFELYYGKKSHGEFVLIGTYYELYIAKKLGLCEDGYADSIINLITSVIGAIPVYGDVRKAAQFAVYDKKNNDDKISVIAPKCEGESVEIKLTVKDYLDLIAECNGVLKEKYENS
ncbi:MAG: 3-dehydroquinate synthase [Clostridia bacterium]|nr:3-dehydroquinate synthase [Clostridia bacterium]